MTTTLVDALLAGIGLPHDHHDARLIETHISWVILAGDYAYKLKKPLDFGFLDFSSLEQRRFYCSEEVRLNQRTAPDIYLDAVPISGSPDAPRVGDDSQPFEYAVMMRRVSHLQTLDEFAHANELPVALVLNLAESIADFHGSLTATPPKPELGTPSMVNHYVEENFTTLAELDTTSEDVQVLEELRRWQVARHKALLEQFQARRDAGHVRECHGDLHLRNIYTDGTTCTLFDCIEFSEGLRWIDTASDIAFLLMDLHHDQHATAAQLLLNEYLQLTGDYDCLALLDYYLVYRALVRAKVDSLREDQHHDDALIRDRTHYLELARSFTLPKKTGIILMCGLSGTGKTFVARRLASEIGAIHIRSDVERKRLFGIDILGASRASGIDIYTDDASRRTFDQLETLAQSIISAGHPVVVDATFIEVKTRAAFIALATRLGVRCVIVHCTAPEDVVIERLHTREHDASEAGTAQYHAQTSRFENFRSNEASLVISIDTTSDRDLAHLAARVWA